MAPRILISVLHFLRINFKPVMSTSNKLVGEFFRTAESRKVWNLHSKSTVHFVEEWKETKAALIFKSRNWMTEHTVP